jgi:hypothetical protein
MIGRNDFDPRRPGHGETVHMVADRAIGSVATLSLASLANFGREDGDGRRT